MERQVMYPVAADQPRVPAGSTPRSLKEEEAMLWLIVGIILLVIAIAGGAIVHPILFALGIVALVMFFMHFRGGGRAVA
jgi:uncharacterized MAPEG superfamily protein